MNIKRGLIAICKPLTALLAVNKSCRVTNTMNRQALADTLSVSTNTVKNWFGNMGLEVPKEFNQSHVILLEIYKLLSSKEPKLSDDKIIGGCLPFMQAAKVVPVDAATHPLTAAGGGGAAPVPAGDGSESFAGLIAEAMQGASEELAPIAACAIVQGFHQPGARMVFKEFLSHSLRAGVDDWLSHNMPTIDVVTLDDGGELPGDDVGTVALPAADEQVKG